MCGDDGKQSILKAASAFFAQAEFDRRLKNWSALSTSTATRSGSSPSARYCRWPRRVTGATLRAGANRELRSARVQRVWHANWQVYGADKVWLQMDRKGIRVARCTIERLMKRLGLQSARRGKKVRTTMPDASAPCPLDRVNRVFKAERPNQLWVSDFTVST